MSRPSQLMKAKNAKHKVFLSYYHRTCQGYRNAFDQSFGHLYVTKSVQPGDIDSSNSDDYIKRLIQEGYVGDASVVVVLVGPKTKCRKHVDWEVSAGLNKKVGGYSGLMGILLPEFPLTADTKYQRNDLPGRLNDNVDSGYAKLYLWNSVTADSNTLTAAIDEAYDRRETAISKIRNSSPQMQRDTCD